MKNFGKNLKVEPKKKGLSEKELFIDIVNVFDECNQRTEDLEETYMMGISNYDEAFYLIQHEKKHAQTSIAIFRAWLLDQVRDNT